MKSTPSSRRKITFREMLAWFCKQEISRPPITRFRPIIEALEDRTLLNAVSWVNTTSGDWSVAANWFDSTTLTNRAPTAGDDVTINQAGVTVTVSDTEAANTVQGSDALNIASGGTFTVNSASQLAGDFSVSGGGSLQLNASLTVSGTTSWQNGTLSGAAALINSGNFGLTGTMNNNGAIVESGAGAMTLSGYATLDNNAGALIDFQTDTGITGAGIVNNSGTIQKSAGAGVSVIGPSANVDLYFNQLGGKLDAQTGTLQLDQTRTSVLETGGTWDAEAGALLDIVGNAGSSTYFAGTFTGSGGGAVELDGGSFAVDSGGANFNFPAGLLQWTGGYIGGQPLTNSGVLTLAGSADKSFGDTFNNNGTIVETGAGNLTLSSYGTLNNNATGVIDIQSDAGITGTGTVNNSGTIQKSAGTGVSVIGPSPNVDLYFNQLGGKLDAQTGTLQLDQTRTGVLETGGTWDAEANATLDIVGNSTSGTYFAGTFTGSGAGSVLLDGGLFYSDSGGANFNFPAGLLQWTGGYIGGQPLTNSGVLTLAGSADKSFGDTFNNNGTIVETGAGNLTLSSYGTLNNNATGVIDIQSDAGITGTGTVNNSGTIQKSAGAGVSEIVPSTNQILYFNQLGGKLDAQTGTLQLNQTRTSVLETGGIWDAETGAFLDIVGNAVSSTYFAGTFTGSGAGAVELDGGSFAADSGGATFNFPGSLLQWTGGTFYGGASNPFTNDGTLTLSGANDKDLASLLVNNGTMIQTGTGNLVFVGYGTLDNQATGLYDLQSDAGIGGNAGPFNNLGTFRKSQSTGESMVGDYINDPYLDFNNTGGTIEALTGHLNIAAPGLLQGGFYNAAANTVLEISGGPSISGILTGSGAGQLDLSGGVAPIDSGLPGATGTLDFPAGYLHWSGGTVGGGNLPLTNAGFMTIDGPNTKYVYRDTIINIGTIIDAGPGDLILNGQGDFITSVINNQAGAVFDFQADANIGTGVGNIGIFINAGVLRKSAGTGIATIHESYNGTPSGLIDVQVGRLRLGNGGNSSGGTFNAESGAVLEFANSFSYFTMIGNITGSGAGYIDFNGGLSGGDDSTPAVLNFAPGYFQMSGTWGGTIENDGFMTLDGNRARAHIINVGTILQTGPDDFTLNANTFFENRGVYDIQTDASITVPNDGSGGNMRFLNTGILRKSSGNGTTQLNHATSGNAFQLDNQGTVEVDSGTLSIVDPIVQISGTTLTGGTWIARNNGILDFPAGANITTNQGNVTLDGAAAVISGLSGLANNQGTLAFLNGGNETTAAAFTNSGSVTAGPASTVTVNGNLTAAPGSSLQVQIGGNAASGQYGQFNITGTATLAGNLIAQLVNGYGPTQGDTFTVFHATAEQSSFGLIAGLKPFFTATVGATSVQITAGASAANIAVQSINVPAGNTVGQTVSIPFAVQNTTAIPISGNWTDSVYLSPTATFGPDAVLFARVPHIGGVAALSSYSATATAALPILTDGDYHVIVVADSSEQVPDNNRTDNTLISTGTLHVSVPALPLGPTTNGTITDGQDELFRIDVGAGAGDLVLSASFAVSRTADLFLSYNTPPTSANAAASFAGQVGTQALLVIPNPHAGSYYLLVQGREGAGTPQAFSLTPRLAGFELRSVTPIQGSNAGQATITVSGSGFTPASTVSLISGGTTRVATTVLFKDSDTLFATFDLTGLSAGPFDVKVSNPTVSTTETGAFTVTAGNPGQVQVQLDAPSLVRVASVSTVTVSYTNIGSTDAPAPLLSLTSDNAEFRLSPQDPWQVGTIQLLGYNVNGPAGVLPPGATGSIAVQFLPIIQAAHAISNFTLSTITDPAQVVDWASLQASLKPATASTAAWNVVFPNFVALVGNTLGSYQAAMDSAATYLSTLGEYTPDVIRLQNVEFQVADNFGAISQRNTLGQFGYGVFGPNDYNVQTLSDGSVAISLGNQVRLFLPNSTGATVFHGLAGDPATATLNTAFNLLVVREPDGSTETFTVTLNAGAITSGRLTATTDTNGNTLTYTANGFSDAFGDTTTYSTDLLGDVIVTDPEGRATTYAFDANKNLISVTDAAGTTSFTYVTGAAATNHAVQSITFPDGSHQYFQYDSLGRLTKSNFDNNADPLTYSYDSVGQVTITDSNNHQTVVSPNDVQQIAQVQNPLGQIVSTLFDANYNPIQQTDPLGGSVSQTNDALGNPTQITDPLGNTIGLTFSPTTDTLTSLTDARGISTSYSSDSRGNLKTITYADGTTQQYRYDAVGNLIESIDQSGQATQYAYNANNLLQTITYSDGSTVVYTYDAHRNLASTTDASGTTTFSYDAADRLTKVTYPDGKFLAYSYNAFGQLMQLSDQDAYTVKYTYDPLGRLSGLTDGTGAAIVSYTYDAVGRLSTVGMGNGTTTTYGYDAAGDVTSVIDTAADLSVISSFVYTYDANGQPLTMTTAAGATTYGYDADGQLISVALPGGRTITYQYDASGNRIAVTDSAAATAAYTVNNLNEYTTVGATSYTYDLDGRLSTKTDATGTTTYTYDVAGRLASVTSPTDTWTYTYDALGDLAATTHNGQQTDNLVDPTGLGNVIAQYQGNTLVGSYTYGLGLASQVTGASSAYYAFDANGNTANLTGATGNVLDTYAYLPFGESLGATGSTANPFTFVGQAGVMTDGSGLQFMRNRFYDSSVGRFTQRDPTGLNGGDVNLYRYVANNPLVSVDPTGLQPPSGPGQFDVDAARQQNDLVYQEFYHDDPKPREVYNQQYENGRKVILGIGVKAATAGLPTGSGPAAKVLNAAVKDYGKMPDSNWGLRAVALEPDKFTPMVRVRVPSGAPGDPNDLSGPAGFGTANFVVDAGTFPYRIDFENEPTANAPAQVVEVTQQLDANLDWNTFQLGSFGFGGQTFTVPAGLDSYTTRIDATATLGIYVDISATFNPLTGALTWIFTSIDPATGDLPADILTGFLPPNVTDPEGDAFVSYTAAPKAGLTTTQTINSEATVIFDEGLSDQSSLNTPEYTNTIDAGAPISSGVTTPATASGSFPVSWAAQDDAGGSGVATYNVYVATNGGPFTLWQQQTSATSATYPGVFGDTYGFAVAATDNVGNTLATPTAAQGTTVEVPVAVQFTSASSDTFVVGKSNSFTIATTSFPATVTLTTNGSLPANVTLIDNLDGTATLSGIPTATTGSYTFNILGDNGETPATTQVFTLTVVDPPTLAATGSATFTLGKAGAAMITAALGLPAVTTFKETGVLPAGVVFTNNKNGTATLSGTPSAGSAGVYTLSIVASNIYASGPPQTFTLTVNGAPGITLQPKSQTIAAGSYVTFTAAANSYPASTVQWWVSTNHGATFTSISGATAASYGFYTSLTETGNEFHAVFHNSSGTATTTNASLTVETAPSVTLDPAPTTTAKAGTIVTLTAVASGSPTPSVQWQVYSFTTFTYVNIPGATAAQYRITATPAVNDTYYRAVFTNPVGHDTTSNANLLVTFAPLITKQPANQTVGVSTSLASTNVTFTAAAVGNPAPTVQWQKSTNQGHSWINITFPYAVGLSDSGTLFRASFTNMIGSVTNVVMTAAAKLTVDLLPTVIGQPVNSTTVQAGQRVTLHASASGTPAPGVQWQVKPAGHAIFVNIPGATAASYTFTATGAMNGNTYQAIFTNAAGQATSSYALLAVNFAPTITQQPISQTIGVPTSLASTNVTFTAAAAGNPVPTVQWQKSTNQGHSWVNITFPYALGLSDSGTLFRASFTNMIGSVTNVVMTAAAKLTVDLLPAVTTQPATATTVNAGATVTLSAATSGTTSTVQWQVKTPASSSFQNIAGATAGQYRFTATAGLNGNVYQAVFKNPVGQAISLPADLTVDSPQRFTSLASATFIIGQAGNFTVTTSGFPYPSLTESGTLPAGVNFVDNGNGTATLSGTPLAGSGRVYSFTIAISPTLKQSFTLTVNQARAITSAGADLFALNQTNSFTITTTGFLAAPITIIGVLPKGVTLTDNKDGTATLKGKPTSAGAFSFTIMVHNGVFPDAFQAFDLTVA